MKVLIGYDMNTRRAEKIRCNSNPQRPHHYSNILTEFKPFFPKNCILSFFGQPFRKFFLPYEASGILGSIAGISELLKEKVPPGKSEERKTA